MQSNALEGCISITPLGSKDTSKRVTYVDELFTAEVGLGAEVGVGVECFSSPTPIPTPMPIAATAMKITSPMTATTFLDHLRFEGPRGTAFARCESLASSPKFIIASG